ncbi:aminotransferase class IV [Clostridiaceae bacterium 14S0207]|nr:aminotransferase class IV [Clostridiaceae bacterium 14S0207]
MKIFENKYYILEGNLETSEEKINTILQEGKIIYEVIRIINGYPLFFKEHMERLINSCKLMDISCLIEEKEMFENVRRLCTYNHVELANVKLIINSITKKYAIYFIHHSYPNKEQYEKGVKTILYHGERNNPNAKVVDNNFRGKVNEKIKETGAFEAILINNEGYITEGSKSNIFMVQNSKVLTAPVEGVLPGITRAKILEVIQNLNLEFEEINYHEKFIKDLDGLFISGTSPKVLPIKFVENYEFDIKNKVIEQIKKAFEEVINNDINSIKNYYIK